MIPWPLQLITSGPFSPSLQHDYTLALLLPTTAAPQKAHVPILNLLSIISVFPALTHPYFQSPPGVGFSLWTSPISPVFRPIQGCASFHIPPSLLGASSGTSSPSLSIPFCLFGCNCELPNMNPANHLTTPFPPPMIHTFMVSDLDFVVTKRINIFLILASSMFY